MGKVEIGYFYSEALPGVLGIQGEGPLFSGSWGALANILRDLGSKEENFQGAEEKTNQGAGEKG